MRPLAVVVLAAGLGKRMRSRQVKVLHPLAGRAMILYPLELVRALEPARTLVVIGPQGEGVRQVVAAAGMAGIEFVEQGEPLGTGHAVGQALAALRGFVGDVLILPADVPLLEVETVRQLRHGQGGSGGGCTLLTTHLDNPAGYGRIVRGPEGVMLRIVEERDATPAQRQITEVNTGVFCCASDFLEKAVPAIGRGNSQGEYYLTDIVELARGWGMEPRGIAVANSSMVLGVNTRAEMALVEGIIRERVRQRLMAEGVRIVDPPTTWIDDSVAIGRDTVIYPNTLIEGACRIGEGCRIGPNGVIRDSAVGDGVVIDGCCVVEECTILAGTRVGPFAHLRPGAFLGERVKVGNFVEVKNSSIGAGSKVSHLSYVGDASLGEGVNVGAGTITCNYDGQNKHQTVIEDGAFVGSDTQLVAPVRVGRGAVVGAGTTVTRDVPPFSLVLSRVPQLNKEGYVKKGEEGQTPAEMDDD